MGLILGARGLHNTQNILFFLLFALYLFLFCRGLEERVDDTKTSGISWEVSIIVDDNILAWLEREKSWASKQMVPVRARVQFI